MNVLKLIIAELIGMFLDDEFLAIAVLAVVGLAAVLSFALHAHSLLVGAVLLIGCVGVVIASVVKAARRG